MDVGLVCDACSALTPIGVPLCKRCGSPVALDPRQRGGGSQPPPIGLATKLSTATTPCPKCGHILPGDHKFCPSCGHRIPADNLNFDVDTRVGPIAHTAKASRSTMMFGVMQSARAKLTLIRGDGEDGVSFTLAGTDHLAGRGECPIAFPDDPFLSPTHANFHYRDSQLVVTDEHSLNGVYIRITGTVELGTDAATVLIGEQVLTVKPIKLPEDVPDAEGTYYSASIVRPQNLEITQRLRGGQSGWVFRLHSETITIGREGNDINFPEDPFISGRHAELRYVSDANMLSVTDLGSRNGTFVRISGEHVLKHGDYVFLGQQLLRVEIV